MTPPVPPRKISKIHAVSLNRNVAQSPVPADTTGNAEIKVNVRTYFTNVPVVGAETPIIYNGDRQWAKVTLTLETAGPVAVGESSQLTPVLSGKGQLLQTGVPTVFNIAKGNKLYVAATGANRISVVVEPYPWLETITGLFTSFMAAVRGAPAVVSALTKR